MRPRKLLGLQNINTSEGLDSNMDLDRTPDFEDLDNSSSMRQDIQ